MKRELSRKNSYNKTIQQHALKPNDIYQRCNPENLCDQYILHCDDKTLHALLMDTLSYDK